MNHRPPIDPRRTHDLDRALRILGRRLQAAKPEDKAMITKQIDALLDERNLSRPSA